MITYRKEMNLGYIFTGRGSLESGVGGNPPV